MNDTPESLATIAEYFRIGLIVGLLSSEQASAWAYSVIAADGEPPHDMIDLAWCKGSVSTIDALAAVQGDRNRQLAGR